MMSLEDVEPCLPCHETVWDQDMASISEELNSPTGIDYDLTLF
jgi:hypothetical protein